MSLRVGLDVDHVDGRDGIVGRDTKRDVKNRTDISPRRSVQLRDLVELWRHVAIITTMFNFAFVGCGGMANWHAQQFRRFRMRRSSRRATRSRRRPRRSRKSISTTPSSSNRMRSCSRGRRRRLDAVVLVTPHTLHYPQAKAAWNRHQRDGREADGHQFGARVRPVGDGQEDQKLLGITFQSPYSQEFGYLATRARRGTTRQGAARLPAGSHRAG